MNVTEVWIRESGKSDYYCCKLNPSMGVWPSRNPEFKGQWTHNAEAFGEYRAYYDTKEEAMEAAVALLVAKRLT